MIAKATADTVKELGGIPFFVPAMAAMAVQLLKDSGKIWKATDYGSIHWRTDQIIVRGRRASSRGLENKVYMDRCAYEADATIIINRVKLHTDFHGPIESA
jgi:hypothetical protein